jgi:hypothetical protein
MELLQFNSGKKDEMGLKKAEYLRWNSWNRMISVFLWESIAKKNIDKTIKIPIKKI